MNHRHIYRYLQIDRVYREKVVPIEIHTYSISLILTNQDKMEISAYFILLAIRHGRKTIFSTYVHMYISQFRIFKKLLASKGGVKSTVSKVFEELKFKISEACEQN